jgi:hypothetical protein
MLAQKVILKEKNPKEEGPEPIAPYPPLCFRINAKPPPGCLYYFAYGLDMNPDRMTTYIQRNMQKRFWGLLFGFQLKFNKKGLDPEAGGFPNIEFNPYTSVEGTLYCITEEELDTLDKHVGYPEHFEHIMLPVWMINCYEPDDYGVAQYCIPALMYIAQDDWTATDDENLAAGYSLSQCIKSADLLTPAYQDYLENISEKHLIMEPGLPIGPHGVPTADDGLPEEDSDRLQIQMDARAGQGEGKQRNIGMEG